MVGPAGPAARKAAGDRAAGRLLSGPTISTTELSFPLPGALETARRAGIRDLPGSDPLPFAGEIARAGSRGFVLSAPLDRETPAAGLLSQLRDPDFHPEIYGGGERLLPFAFNQLGMQLRKLRLGVGS